MYTTDTQKLMEIYIVSWQFNVGQMKCWTIWHHPSTTAVPEGRRRAGTAQQHQGLASS